MCMERYRNILRKEIVTTVLLCMAIVFVGCKNETDTTLTQQQQSIEKYLTSSHNPRLIEETEIANSPQSNPPFYTRWDMDIYRYIATYYDEGREKLPEITNGSTFDITYTAYIFNGNAPQTTDMFATNDAAQLEELKAMGLTPTYEWSTEPKRVTMGKGDLFASLETALESCREGDDIEVYLTYPEAYGKNYIGKVPSKSAQMWKIKIEEVIE